MEAKLAEAHAHVENTVDVDLSFLVEPALAQFAFFERAVKLLERSSDSEIAGWVEAYENFLAAANAATADGATESSSSSDGNDVTAPNVDLGVELVWR